MVFSKARTYSGLDFKEVLRSVLLVVLGSWILQYFQRIGSRVSLDLDFWTLVFLDLDLGFFKDFGFYWFFNGSRFSVFLDLDLFGLWFFWIWTWLF